MHPLAERTFDFQNRERHKEKLESLCLPNPRRPAAECLHPSAVPFKPAPYVRENPFTVTFVDSPFKVLVESAEDLLQTTDPMSEIRFQVFSYLWKRGNFVTGGSNFSADFLLYEGEFRSDYRSRISRIGTSLHSVTSKPDLFHVSLTMLLEFKVIPRTTTHTPVCFACHKTESYQRWT